jgi:hypothetical protein
MMVAGGDAGRACKTFAGWTAFAGSVLRSFLHQNRKPQKICRFDRIWRSTRVALKLMSTMMAMTRKVQSSICLICTKINGNNQTKSTERVWQELWKKKKTESGILAHNLQLPRHGSSKANQSLVTRDEQFPS